MPTHHDRRRLARPRWIAALVAAIVGIAGPAAAGDPPPGLAVTAWTVDEGLPQNSINDLCLDRDGYLWVATYGGLARFDGAHFETFNAGHGEGLSGSRFEQLALDAEGRLLVFGEEVGLLRFDGQRFEEVHAAGTARDVVLDGTGDVLLLTDGGLVRIGPDGVQELVGGFFSAMLVDPAGPVWLATIEGRIACFVDGQLTWKGTDQGLPGNQIMAMRLDAAGRLWCSTKVGIWRGQDGDNAHFERLDWAPERVLSMVDGRNGELWLGGRTGLFRADEEAGRAELILEGTFEELCPDGTGKLWLGGSRSGGLHLVHGSPLRDLAAVFPIPAADTWSIQPGRPGHVLVVQTRTLIDIGPEGTTITELGHNCRAAHRAGDGTLWLGRPSGVERHTDGGVELIDSPDAVRGGVRAILEDAEGTLWFAGRSGVCREVDGELVQLADPSLVDVMCLQEDRERGCMWAGTQRGLARIEGDTVTWLTAEDGLAAGSVRALHLSAGGDLWIGTYGGGLCRLRGDELARVGVEDGLADGFLASILEDDAGRLWLSSNRGPFAVSLDELDAFLAGRREQVRSCTFSTDEAAREANGGNQNTGWKAPDGTLWFVTIDGVTQVHPDLLSNDEPAPRPRIEAVAVTDERSVTARFTALDFTAPARLRVQYRLTGSSERWVEAGGDREVHFSYLPPGDYALEVRARNGFGDWSPAVRRTIEIPARFHESPVFFFSILIAVGLAIFALTEVRIRSVHRRAERLQRLHDERDQAERALARSQAALGRLTRRLLSSRAAELRRVSAELHDDVTQRLAALAMQAEVAQQLLSTAESSERLVEITRVAQELAGDVQQLSRRLHPQGLRVLGLEQALRQEAEAFTRRTGLPVDLDLNGGVGGLAEDVSLEAFRIVQEGLHNIEKHAGARKITIASRSSGAACELTLTDDGAGFDLEGGEERGLGLVTMRERAATVGGTLDIRTAPGSGTTLRLSVPPGGAQP